ncbi:MAG: ABC transporter substrate-binding protein [Pseudomonadota bacterium]
MRNMVTNLSITFVLLITALFSPTPALAEGIKVGVILPLTGKLAPIGKIERDSFLMAMEEINAAGGIRGRTIDLILEDTASRPEMGRLAIKKLVSKDKAIVVGGGCSSPVTYEVAALAQEEKIPFVINTASADKITEEGWKYVFRLNPPASEYTRTLALFLKEVARVKTAAVLFEDGPFGRFGLKRFLRMCKRSDLKVLIKRGYEPEMPEFKSFLMGVANKKPDLVYLASHAAETSMIMHQAMELDFNPGLFVWHPPGLTIPESFEYAGSASEYIFTLALWSPYLPYPGAKEYYKKFFERFNSSPDYHGAEAYSAMYVIADALKRTRSLAPGDVRDALAGTNMMTVFGPVKFTSYGKKTQQNLLPTLVLQRLRGRFEVVWPRGLAAMEYIYPVPKWKER